MTHDNEFVDDPPTVVATRMKEIKLPPPKIEISVDPMEAAKFSAVAWAVKNSHWISEVGGFIAIIMTAILLWTLAGIFG